MLGRMDGASGPESPKNPRAHSRFGPSVPASAAGAVLLATVLATVPDAIAQSSGQGEPSSEQSAAGRIHSTVRASGSTSRSLGSSAGKDKPSLGAARMVRRPADKGGAPRPAARDTAA